MRIPLAALLALAGTLASPLVAAPGPAPAKVTPPADFFGFQLGADRKLADWAQLTAYYQKLAQQSRRIRFADLGKTTEGRPFVLVTISDPANLAQLAHYQRINAELADPRSTPPAVADRLIAEGKSILVITCNIHSTEIASSQTAAEFAYEMATGSTPEIQNILRNDIILLVPSLNPDGQQLVVDWYKKYLGTPYEGMSPVVLYQKYVGHDDNRDWYMFTQAETRLTVEHVLNPWHPQILYDVHQMGANGPRLFLPPWVDPIDPNVDPIIVTGMNAVGMDTARELTAQGKSGVLVDGVYDGFSPARQYIVYHGGLRLLTESASVRIASPETMPFDRLGKGIGYDAKVAKWNFPEPWPGGEWHLGDIVSYQLAAFYSIARNMAVNRELFLRSFYTVGQHAIARSAHADWPFAYVVPAAQKNPLATATLVNTLREGGVEIHRADAPFSAVGRSFASGSYIIPLDQPYGSFAKTLLEDQHYPDIRQYPGGPPQRPYDVTAQTLPLLLGVDAVAVPQAFTASSRLVAAPVHATPGSVPSAPAAGYRFRSQNNGSLLALWSLLADGAKAERLAGGSAPGAIFLPNQPGLSAKLAPLAATDAVSLDAAVAPSVPEVTVRLPRVALYQSWVPQIDEGWTRWIFDQDHIPYTRIQDADLRRGDLNARFDAIIIADQNARSIENGNPASRVPPEYAGGVGSAGMANLKAFVQAGGTLVALNQASLAFLDWTGGAVQNALEGVGNTAFYSPGSILAAQADPSNPLAWGADPQVAIFSQQSPAFTVRAPATSAVTYGSGNALLSGWLLGGDKLPGRSALALMPLGAGHLVLFGFKPQYRAQSEAAYRFLFNALLLSAASPAALP